MYFNSGDDAKLTYYRAYVLDNTLYEHFEYSDGSVVRNKYYMGTLEGLGLTEDPSLGRTLELSRVEGGRHAYIYSYLSGIYLFLIGSFQRSST